MSKIQFNERQTHAIESRGDALLVSAAAGSGKTAVLVERVLRYLTEQGGDISRLMIMTFTEAAAAEMKQKIKKAVDRYLQEQLGNERMRYQSTLIDSAEIGTIHSICLGLITRHFEKLGLDPRFRLIDATIEQQMLEEELDRLIEELYQPINGKPNLLVECFSDQRDDDQLRELLIDGMRFLDKQPLADDYIRRAMDYYEHPERGLFACFAEDGLYRYIHLIMERLSDRHRYFLREIERHPRLSSEIDLLAFLREEQARFDEWKPLLEKRDYDLFYKELGENVFKTLTWKKLAPNAEEKDKKFLTGRRDAVKKGLSDFKKSLAPEKQELLLLEQNRKLLRCYFDACNRLRKRLEQARRSSGWINFQDMEQLAVQLLVEDYDPAADRLTPTPLALQLREHYDEIIIDEFQDTNRAQDLIFRALSKDEKNLFMVGDIKQSIYRFRGAEPEIFAQKRANSAPWTERALKEKTVLELNANYRSHGGVLRFANAVFEGLMSPSLGGVNYDDRERLIPARKYDQPEECRAELHWLAPDDDENGEKGSTVAQNAAYTASLIRKAVENKEPLLLPDGGSRPVEYRDFAILLHTAAGTADVYEKALKEQGIPAENNNEGTDFYNRPEIQSLLSFLMVLNNPYDNIALVTLLFGDLFRFDIGELAALRRRNTPLYDNLKAAAAENPRAADALALIEKYRRLSGELYVYDLLYRIYRECGLTAAYAAEQGGAEKCANLELLAEDARSFEKNGYRGLYAFIQHLSFSRSLPKKGAKLSADTNRVFITTIHKSKGLEFPICILGDSHKRFNQQDQIKKILLHSRCGAAVENIIPEQFTHFPSLAQKVLKEQIHADKISEEERVFYVALTRAQSKTIVLLNSSVKQMTKWMEQGQILGSVLPAWLITGFDSSYGRWLATLLGASLEGEELAPKWGLLQQSGGKPLYLKFVAAQAEKAGAACPAPEPALHFDRSEFRARLDWQYPHLAAVRLPAKLSVSELKGLRDQDPEAQPLLEEQLKLNEPRFLNRFRPRGNERGNALHQALQFCNFEQLRRDPEGELDRLVAQKFITAAQRELIDLAAVSQFTKSPCFDRLLSADYYEKEQRFLFPMEASRLFGAEAEGEILIQGVLDCFSVSGGEAEILDYKTDRVDQPEELIRRYQVQLELYAEALKQVKGLRVTRCTIYSFALGREISL